MAVSQPASHELRIAVAGLEVGMFVSRLDRSWIGSGFPLEGVLLLREVDLARLRALCRHVHVDILRGKAPSPSHVVPDAHVDAPEARPAHGPRATVPAQLFGPELTRAEQAHETLQAGIREAMEDVRNGAGLDAEKLAQAVDLMLDSISRNPLALPWVMEMRRKGDYVYQHALACSIWAATFGCHLGLEREDLRELAVGALLCDVGKVRLPQSLLDKSGPMSAHEMTRLHGHVGDSCAILDAGGGFPRRVRDMVAHHHERYDGSGYPDRLRGTAIPLFARIAGIVDSYDAMISTRPYAASRSPHEAVMELYDARDRLFQSELVEQFIRTCGIYPTGSLVELTDGTVGVVMSVDARRRLRPRVMRILGADKRPLADFRLVDLADVEVDADGRPLGVRGGLPQGAYGIDRAALFLD